MDMGLIFLFLIFLFSVIYFAVKLAINPLLDQQEGSTTDIQGSDLVKLRDMDVLNNDELEEVIQLFQEKNQTKGNMEQFQRYAKILDELKEMKYFTDEQAHERTDKLRGYFKVD